MLCCTEFLRHLKKPHAPFHQQLHSPTHSCLETAFIYVLAIIINNSMNNEIPVNNLLGPGGEEGQEEEGEPPCPPLCRPSFPCPSQQLPSLPLVPPPL